MLFLPLPFVVALFLLALLAALLRGRDERPNPVFVALIALCALQSVMVGLRWGYGVTGVGYLMPVLAACLPPLVYVGFRSLVHRDEAVHRLGTSVHAVPLAYILVLMVFAPRLIDGALVALFVGYALALLALGRAGPDALDEVRFDSVAGAHRALRIAAGALLVAAAFDLVILADFEWSIGVNVAALAGNANVLMLLFIGWAAMATSRVRATVAPAPAPGPDPALAAADRDVLARIEALFSEQHLYRDENLTLSRLARRAGVPARTLSGAVNRLTGGNVSQFVNSHRIAEACRLLAETDLSVTQAMYQAGFQTKSNFNREFLRITGLSPVAWRQGHGKEESGS
ncbi:helix-turn-helix domain-containing protein [Hoeflea olei]|uniref:AraC family transcriptional regulator n=1 Tax=Hoeflea olei TaxID=1480615 RepID=A0A1C1YYK4_9HYPH|nr:AraC family transcriptional regulator [Hoeflea olei]OCW58565.1 AraC family transcriptional regulator [Hoeflea olei]